MLKSLTYGRLKTYLLCILYELLSILNLVSSEVISNVQINQRGNTCYLPAVNQWTSDIISIKESHHLICQKFSPFSFDVDATELLYEYSSKLPSSASIHNGTIHLKSAKELSFSFCNALPINRLDDNSITYGLPRLDLGSSYQISENDSHFMVFCHPKEANLNLDNYQEYNDAALSITKQFLLCGSKKYSKRIETNNKRFNILLLGLDSTSRLDLERYLPKTHKFLLSAENSILFKKYTIIGDGTTASLLALLTGKFETELPEARKKYQDKENLKSNDSSILDTFNWLWDEFKNIGGYVTHFIEDSPEWGTFQYRLTGFGSKKGPTDEYGRPCMIAALPDNRRKASKVVGCTFSRPTHQILLESFQEVFLRNPDNPIFSLTFMSEMFHEISHKLNYLDEDILKVLKRFDVANKGLEDNSPFADTIVILFSDHGPRFGKRRLSLQGKIEERLPLLYMMFPPAFVEIYNEQYRNILGNRDELMTMFDMHHTLVDLLHLEMHGQSQRKSIDDSLPIHGQSLFQPVPKNRTCEEAAVAEHWCPCINWHTSEQNVSDVILSESAILIKKFINHIVEATPISLYCSSSPDMKVISASFGSLSRKVQTFDGSKDIDGRIPIYKDQNDTTSETSYLMLRIGISNVFFIFDVTLKFPLNLNTFNEIELSISRLDAYEDEVKKCLNYFHSNHRKFCVCK